MKHLVQIVLLCSLAIGTNALADNDHERARELVRSGEIISLEQLLKMIVDKQAGKLRLLEAELEHDQGRLVYELEMLDEHGEVHELLFDAKTGEALDEEAD